MSQPVPRGDPQACLCGCGGLPKRGRRFLSGHDRFAETAVVKMRYGSVEALLEAHGYGRGGKPVREAYLAWSADNQARPVAGMLRRLRQTRAQMDMDPARDVDVTSWLRAGRAEREEQMGDASTGGG